MAGRTFDTIPGLASEAGKKSKRGKSKISGDTKEKIASLVDKLYNNVMANLNSLDLKDQAQLLTKLIEYQIPKRRAVESTIDLSILTEEEIDKKIKMIINNA